MNEPLSNTAIAVDFVFWLITGISAFFLVLITGLMIYFAVRYHHKRNPQPENIREHPWLEITWTVIPTLIVLVMFWYGYRAFLTLRQVPADAMPIKVTGMMWKWEFEYPNGKRTEVLYVPVNKAIRIDLKSNDVLHGFYIPAFRVKEDVVPGKENYLWFKPQGIGPADIFCSQYCGVRHAYMISRVEVMSEAEFADWYESTNTSWEGAVDITKVPGIALLESKGCLVCHRLDGSRGVGPSLMGLFGSKVTVIEKGKEKQVVADEEYLRRSLKYPSAQITKGYQDLMPPVPNMTEADLDEMVKTMKQLK